jgi:hypothetical protein
MGTYAKAVAAIIATALSAAVVALTGDNHFSNVEIVNIAIAIVGAVGVFYVPNAPNGPVAKSVVATLLAMLTLVATFVGDGSFANIDLSQWLQIVLAGLGALGVYGVRNSPSPAVS